MVCAETVELGPELSKVGEIADADCPAADLGLIGRTDAAPRSADLAGARGVLAQSIEVAVDWKDQRAGLGDAENVGGNVDALLADALDLGLQCPWIEHHAVADDGWRAADDPARQQR